MSYSDCGEIISTSDIINHCLQEQKNTIIPGEQSLHYRPDTIIPLSRERLDMAAYTFSYHMENGCALEKDSFWGNKYVWELLLNLGLKNILLITKCLDSRKDVSVDFFSHLCQQPLHTFMRIKVTKMKEKYYGIHQMDQQESYVLSQFCQRDPWVARISIHTIHQS